VEIVTHKLAIVGAIIKKLVMKIIHYISPRACGKTTAAKEMQMEDPEGVLLFTHSKRDGWNWGENERVPSRLRKKWNKIILDEYILQYNSLGSPSEKDRFISWLYQVIIPSIKDDGELVLISTPDKIYSQELMLLALIQQENPAILRLANREDIDVKGINNQIQELYRKFLIPSREDAKNKIEVVKKDFGYNLNLRERSKFQFCYELGKQRYHIDCLGEYILKIE